MNRNLTPKNSKTYSRPGQRPYLYAHGRDMVSEGTGTTTTSTSTNTSAPTTITPGSSGDRSDSMPAHWLQVVS